MSSLIDSLLLEPYSDGFDVYVAFRSEKGSGTLNDPFGADTQQKFDAMMKALSDFLASYQAAHPDVPAGMLIHLGPGEFQTNGYSDYSAATSWQARGRMRIVGSGVDVTSLKLVNATNADTQYFAVGHELDDGTNASPAHFFEISDLTIDCGLPSSGTMACGAIRLMGNHVRVSRVKAVNWGNRSSLTPCRVISLLTGDRTVEDIEISNCGMEDCIAVEPSRNGNSSYWVTALHVGNNTEGLTTLESFGKGPYIRNCYVDAISLQEGASPVDPLSYNIRGLAMSCCRGGVIEGNQIHNVSVGGPYLTTSSTPSLIIRNNTYKNVGRAVYCSFGQVQPSTPTALTSLVRDSSDHSRARATVSGHGLKVSSLVQVGASGGSDAAFKGTFLVLNVPASNQFEYQMSAEAAGNASSGVYQKLFGVGTLVIEGNVIEIARGSSGVIAIQIDDGKSDTDAQTAVPVFPVLLAVIRGNLVRYVDGQIASTDEGLAVKIAGVKCSQVEENSILCYPQDPLRDFRCGSVTYFNNKTPDGTLIQGFNGLSENHYDELETDAEDALILGFLK